MHLLLNDKIFDNSEDFEDLEDTDLAELEELQGITVKVYTVSYNILRVMSGMAGVAFAAG